MHSTLELDVRVDSITEALRTLTDNTPAPPSPRTRTLDRLALRIGLALLLWGARRHRAALTHEARAQLLKLEHERAAREHGAQRRALLAPSSR